MLKFIAALALSLLSFGAQAQRVSYLEVVPARLIVQPTPPDKSLIHQLRFPRGGSVSPTMAAFIGNPNVTISAIGGSIATNLDNYSSTCEVPCSVMVSMSGVTATGTSAPYEDLSPSWNFGEGCGETFTRPTDGASVCSGSGQRGPEAAYIFDTPGTKTITLQLAGCAGGVGLVGTANQGICTSLYGPVNLTKTITVSAFSGTRNEYVDCSATPGADDGSLAHPWTNLNQVKTTVSLGNLALHFKPAVNCTRTGSGGGIYFDHFTPISKIRIDKVYPGFSGVNPKIITSTGADVYPLTVKNNANLNDLVISDIDFENTVTTVNGVISFGFTTVNTITNVLLRNVTATQSVDCSCQNINIQGTTTSVDQLITNFGMWNFTGYSNPAFLLTDVGMGGSAYLWHYQIGGSITGAGNSGQGQSQHVYPDVKTHGLWMWVTCGPTGAAGTIKMRTYCFNLNWDGKLSDPTDHQIAQYQAVVENSCQYVLRCFDLGNRTNNSNPADSTAVFQYVVISGNAIINQGAADFQCGLSVTVRDNRVWGSMNLSGIGGGFFQPSSASQISGYKEGDILLSKFYRNKVYQTSGSNAGALVRFEFTWTTKQFVTDNWIVDARATAELQNFTWANLISSASVVDRNLYSSTASFANAWQDNGTGKSFALWQAAATTPNRWDAAGSNITASCPSGWTCPVLQWSHMN